MSSNTWSHAEDDEVKMESLDAATVASEPAATERESDLDGALPAAAFKNMAESRCFELASRQRVESILDEMDYR